VPSPQTELHAVAGAVFQTHPVVAWQARVSEGFVPSH
jgi:hypothetical protein